MIYTSLLNYSVDLTMKLSHHYIHTKDCHPRFFTNDREPHCRITRLPTNFVVFCKKIKDVHGSFQQVEGSLGYLIKILFR